MHMKYDSHIPEKNPVHKDVAPATQSGSHVPFFGFSYTTGKGINNNATTTETQKDISVVEIECPRQYFHQLQKAWEAMCCHLSIN